jgi:threonine dehydratase
MRKRKTAQDLGISIQEIKKAHRRIRKFLPVTPLTHSPLLSKTLGFPLYIKWDNKLRTGSFKERGALNFMLSMGSALRGKTLCAASAGNHALALSYHAAQLGIPCQIVMPHGAPVVKIAATRATGAKVELYGERFDEALAYAKDLAERRGYVFVPAYDHPLIVAGQASCGLEILRQLHHIDTVVVPVGGGGLISGIALAIKQARPRVRIVGVRSDWVTKPHATNLAPALRPRSLADGIAVKTPGALTSTIIKQKVDQMLSVGEAEIAHAMLQFLELERSVVEGAGAAALAALLAGKLGRKPRNAIVLACGSNVDIHVIARLIEHELGATQRLIRLSTDVPDRPGALHTLTGILSECQANVVEVTHDRSFSRIPGYVSIHFVLEVRDHAHTRTILRTLSAGGVSASIDRSGDG